MSAGGKEHNRKDQEDPGKKKYHKTFHEFIFLSCMYNKGCKIINFIDKGENIL
jgi:hypothetical protein